MSSPFDLMRDTLYASALGNDGIYTSGAVGTPIRWMVARVERDGLHVSGLSFRSSASAQTDAKRISVSAAVVVQPKRGDTVTIGGLTYPLRDNGWTLDDLAQEWTLELGKPT